MVNFKMNQSGLEALAQQAGDRIKGVDRKLRATPLVGQPVDQIKAQAASALGAIGVTLPDAQLTAYAQSIADGDDFEFQLAF
jgi:hypothetical protein